MSVLVVVFEIYRIALRVLTALAGAHFLSTTVTFLRRRAQVPPSEIPEVWPHVTVQLPIRNEFYTAARVLEAVAGLDYPTDRLEIQVLDDSDDGTSETLAAVVERLQTEGFDVVHVRRDFPANHKAGALQVGLEHAKGEYLAVFDADFVPGPDFLRRTVPFFCDAEVALVQGRWAHLNRDQSWFTRLQAQILDGLFIVEQTAKSRAGLPIQFNGTAGVWRKTAITSAGGWKFDSLTEDFDLSMRAILAGWRLVHLPDVAVPAELPTTLGLFRVQQRRWALGSAQLLRKRLLDVLRSELPWGARKALVMHLGRHFVYPLLLVMVLTVPLTTFYWVDTPIRYGLVNAAVLGVAFAGIAAQQVTAAAFVGRSRLEAIVLAAFVIPLAIGLAPTYAVALWYGLRDRAGPFDRTPKVPRAPKPGEPEYRAKRSILVVVEIAVGLAYTAFVGLALARGFWMEAAFMAVVAYAYLWVGLGSLRVSAGAKPAVDTAPASRGALPAAPDVEAPAEGASALASGVPSGRAAGGR